MVCRGPHPTEIKYSFDGARSYTHLSRGTRIIAFNAWEGRILGILHLYLGDCPRYVGCRVRVNALNLLSKKVHVVSGSPAHGFSTISVCSPRLPELYKFSGSSIARASQVVPDNSSEKSYPCLESSSLLNAHKALKSCPLSIYRDSLRAQYIIVCQKGGHAVPQRSTSNRYICLDVSPRSIWGYGKARRIIPKRATGYAETLLGMLCNLLHWASIWMKSYRNGHLSLLYARGCTLLVAVSRRRTQPSHASRPVRRNAVVPKP